MRHLFCVLALAAVAMANAATITLQPGQTGMLGGQKVTLLTVRDSRCPVGVMCVWSGELQATVLVSQQGRVRTLKLSDLRSVQAANPWPGLRIESATRTVRENGKTVPLKITLSDQPAQN